jgi:hypothetical protein
MKAMPRPNFPTARLVCTSCGHETDRPDQVMPSSIWMTAALLPFFVVPAVLHWVWRATSKKNVCPLCTRDTLIPSTSPIGRQILHAAWRSADTPTPLPTADARLERIEQAIDAMAIEVERVAEAQRYAARLLTDRSSADRGRDQRVTTPT